MLLLALLLPACMREKCEEVVEEVEEKCEEEEPGGG
jgi:hypothetical protein